VKNIAAPQKGIEDQKFHENKKYIKVSFEHLGTLKKISKSYEPHHMKSIFWSPKLKNSLHV